MILDLKLPRNSRGMVTANPSKYKPDQASKERIQEILQSFELSRTIMRKPYREFNDMSVLDRQSMDQASFNAYVPPASEDPDEAWKSNAIRPIVRNRTISIAAHVTGTLIYPQVFAQNEHDEEDKDAATVMRDLMEYASEEANYAQTFLYAVIAALVNPGVIVHSEFAEVYRTIKDIQADGTWTKKQVLDEIMSGFKDLIVPLDEMFISDIYQPDIQLQPYLIWRRAIDYSLAQAKYGDSENFKAYVRPGVQMMFDESSGDFYEQTDTNLKDRLVEEIIYYNRFKDLQVVMCNGVLVTDPEQPNPRLDKKYPFAKSGYELFDEGKFFYYSSLVKKMSKDEEIVNSLYRMIIDGTFLQLMPPTAVFGDEVVDSSVVTPGTTTTFSADSKIEKIDVGNNLAAGYNALEKVESSISESSNDILQSGQGGGGQPQTAFEISRLEQNARVMLGLFAKMVGFLVKQMGDLRMSDIIQHMTVADVDELTGTSDRLKFQSFLIPEKNVNGAKKTRKIVFDTGAATSTDFESRLAESQKIMSEEGGSISMKQIYRVNPEMWRKNKFRTKVTPDVVTPPSDNVKKALNLEAYDRAVQSPFANQEMLYRDLLLGSYEATRHDVDKYVTSQSPMGPGSELTPEASVAAVESRNMAMNPANKQQDQSSAPLKGKGVSFQKIFGLTPNK